MPSVLEVPRAVYTSSPENFAEPVREQVVAEIAGISMKDLVLLEGAYEGRVRVDQFELPQYVDDPVVGFRAYSLWPGIKKAAPRGGTRFTNSGDRLEASHLARGMDHKFMLHNQQLHDAGVIDLDEEVPVGGKGEIIVPIHPRHLPKIERANIITAYTTELIDRGYFFDGRHRTGPDMNMSPEDMALMRDTIVARGTDWNSANSLITGKPIEEGGVAGREESTPRGGATVIDEYFRLLGVEPGTRADFSIQGFGNAGSPLVGQFNEVSEYEGKLLCVADETGTLYAEKGIDPIKFKNLLFQRDREGDKKYIGVLKAGLLYRHEVNPDSEVKSIGERPDMWLEVPADVFVPAATANGINLDNVDKLVSNTPSKTTKFVMPLANQGVSTQAQIVLERHGIRTAHHAHVNAHGVIGSLVESGFAKGRFKGENPSDPGTVYRIIGTIARMVTRDLFDLSNSGSKTPTASMSVAAEARRLQVLQNWLG